MSTTSDTDRIATRIRCLSDSEPSGWRGTVWLYRLDPPCDGAVFVVSSAVHFPLCLVPHEMDWLETLVFASDEDGNVRDWSEIGGESGYIDCDRAIIEMGYRIRSEVAVDDQ